MECGRSGVRLWCLVFVVECMTSSLVFPEDGYRSAKERWFSGAGLVVCFRISFSTMMEEDVMDSGSRLRLDGVKVFSWSLVCSAGPFWSDLTFSVGYRGQPVSSGYGTDERGRGCWGC